MSGTKIQLHQDPEQTGTGDLGCGVGTQYHWLVVGNQRVRKIDADCYDTFMQGMKFKVGYKKPNWRDYSYTYPGQESREEVIRECLKLVLDRGL